MSTVKLSVVGLAAAILAAVLVGLMRFEFVGSGNAAGGGATVVVAVRDLPPGHQLEATDLEEAALETSEVTGDMVRSMTAAIGQTTIVPLVRGQALRSSGFATLGSGQAIASQLEPGFRAITLTLRNANTGIVLFPGAFVDVIATLQAPLSPDSARETITKTLLERRQVLAVDDHVIGGVPDASGRSRPRREVTVTLAVTLGEAEQIELARDRGTIGLALRSSGDLDPTGRGGSVSTTNTLLQSAVQPPPDAGNRRTPATESSDTTSVIERSPAATTPRIMPIWEVIVIRGNDVETHRFSGRGPQRNRR